MRTILSLLFVVRIALFVNAQSFPVGSTCLTLHDDTRNRDVPCTVYYPAVAAGAEQLVASGAFPTLKFGHGFVMSVSAYAYVGQHYAGIGYIVALPSTEGGISPNHGRFGEDLAFVSNAFQGLGTDAASIFNGHVAPASALMGHSMGGGAAILGASGNSEIQAVVVLAPAETTPSAIAAAAQISVPTLIIAASEDCVTPIAQHSQPMYDATGASCKAFVNILGGGHCYFGDSSPTCSLGELTCGPNLTISRQEQHQAVLDVADLWLERFLIGIPQALITFSDTLANSPRFTSQFECLATGVAPMPSKIPFTAQWMAGTHSVGLLGLLLNDIIDIYDVTGKTLAQGTATSDRSMLKMPSAVNGILLVRIQRDGQSYLRRVPAID